MLSYPYIESLFRAILTESKVIQGRFHIAPYWATELNASNLNQLVKETIGELAVQKYPLCLMMPPRTTGDFSDDQDSREQYGIVLLFLAKSFTNGDGSVKNPNALTGTSMHAVTDDWHDMQKCAKAFMRTLRQMWEHYGPMLKLSISGREPQNIVPISTIGDDRASGVMLQFSATLFAGCEDLEDYAPNYLTKIQLPA